MSRPIRYMFAVHALVAAVAGAALLAAPGRFLQVLGWAPIDPLLSRVLGAACLGLAWGSWRGFSAPGYRDVAILVEVEALFCVLTCAGLLRNMVGSSWPWYVWVLLGSFVVFAVAWLWVWVRGRGSRQPVPAN